MIRKDSELCEQLIKFKFLKADKRNKFKNLIFEKKICPAELVCVLLNDPFLIETEKNKKRKEFLLVAGKYLVDELYSFIACDCCETDIISFSYEEVLDFIRDCTETDERNGLTQKSLASKLGLKPDTLNNWIQRKRKKPEIILYRIYYGILISQGEPYLENAKHYFNRIFESFGVEVIIIKKEQENTKMQSYSFSLSLFYLYYRIFYVIFFTFCLIFFGNLLVDSILYFFKDFLKKYKELKIVYSYCLLFIFWFFICFDYFIKFGFHRIYFLFFFCIISLLFDNFYSYFFDFLVSRFSFKSYPEF